MHFESILSFLNFDGSFMKKIALSLNGIKGIMFLSMKVIYQGWHTQLSFNTVQKNE